MKEQDRIAVRELRRLAHERFEGKITHEELKHAADQIMTRQPLIPNIAINMQFTKKVQKHYTFLNKLWMKKNGLS